MHSARTTTLEALVMWANNRNSERLDSLPTEDKEYNMNSARSHAKGIHKYKERATGKHRSGLHCSRNNRRERERKRKRSRFDL